MFVSLDHVFRPFLCLPAPAGSISLPDQAAASELAVKLWVLADRAFLAQVASIFGAEELAFAVRMIYTDWLAHRIAPFARPSGNSSSLR